MANRAFLRVMVRCRDRRPAAPLGAVQLPSRAWRRRLGPSGTRPAGASRRARPRWSFAFGSSAASPWYEQDLGGASPTALTMAALTTPVRSSCSSPTSTTNDQVLLPAAHGTEGDAPAGWHTGGALHRLLDVLGVVLEAQADDDLARPARHEQLAVGHVAEVAHAEPIAENRPSLAVLT